jgi:hypothetical protein
MARQPEVFVRELDPTEAQRLSRLILRKLSAGIELALQRSTDSMSVLAGRCEDARQGRSRSVDSRMRAWHISPFTSLKSRKKLLMPSTLLCRLLISRTCQIRDRGTGGAGRSSGAAALHWTWRVVRHPAGTRWAPSARGLDPEPPNGISNRRAS